MSLFKSLTSINKNRIGTNNNEILPTSNYNNINNKNQFGNESSRWIPYKYWIVSYGYYKVIAHC
ncbi:hypothetical protein DDB_G0295745 [Dictyostelium discoideum AX4]|uniref:Uncharacterized protein n=1 Tax=Dictyostelium discoideum TaxID=44689 RepID=C7G060_DICDI|nr:hypothetical protein DDB_G0295745 [Dictyostelium discoideum AX4]EEU04059.1 hypothetical protein DDB_G0295745 [Dictyostelium discoideum AX4]|eukprot:XP_002649111.1 hypothetical protein DDB_G0295745 [Dictyostelium discoideum AX4]